MDDNPFSFKTFIGNQQGNDGVSDVSEPRTPQSSASNSSGFSYPEFFGIVHGIRSEISSYGIPSGTPSDGESEPPADILSHDESQPQDLKVSKKTTTKTKGSTYQSKACESGTSNTKIKQAAHDSDELRDTNDDKQLAFASGYDTASGMTYCKCQETSSSRLTCFASDDDFTAVTTFDKDKTSSNGDTRANSISESVETNYASECESKCTRCQGYVNDSDIEEEDKDYSLEEHIAKLELNLAKLKEENKTLFHRHLQDAIEIGILKQDAAAMKLKEARETKTLQTFTSRIELSLKIANEKASNAENRLEKFEEEHMKLQEENMLLKEELKQFKDGVRLEPEILESLSGEISNVAKNAEATLKGMLRGTKKLKITADHLSSIAKFKTVKE